MLVVHCGLCGLAPSSDGGTALQRAVAAQLKRLRQATVELEAVTGVAVQLVKRMRADGRSRLLVFFWCLVSRGTNAGTAGSVDTAVLESAI